MFSLLKVKYKNILDIEKLDFPAKGVTCIVGQSGSGKTTLLKLLNQMITQDSGDIYYNGENILSLEPVQLRRQVMMLPQQAVVFPGNIKENLLKGFVFAGTQFPADEVLYRYMAKVLLTKDLGDQAENLSGGEKQRMALIRLLLLEPAVLLLDEPSSALDEDTEKLIIEMLVEVTRLEGKSMIMVTHSRSIADYYGDRIISLDGGSVMEVRDRAMGRDENGDN